MLRWRNPATGSGRGLREHGFRKGLEDFYYGGEAGGAGWLGAQEHWALGGAGPGQGPAGLRSGVSSRALSDRPSALAGQAVLALRLSPSLSFAELVVCRLSRLPLEPGVQVHIAVVWFAPAH